jgi:adenosylhomocysteinase
VTGDRDVVNLAHIALMKDGAIISNSGHFDVEIDVAGIEKTANAKREIRDLVDEYTFDGGKRVILIAGGRLVNLATAEGHPSSVMDMSFANQALAAEYLVKEGKNLEKKVYPIPPYLDDEIAKMKLESMGVTIDELTPDQETYLTSWQQGT